MFCGYYGVLCLFDLPDLLWWMEILLICLFITYLLFGGYLLLFVVRGCFFSYWGAYLFNNTVGCLGVLMLFVLLLDLLDVVLILRSVCD